MKKGALAAPEGYSMIRLPADSPSTAALESRLALSVIVPCRDEEANLPELVQRLTAACAAVTKDSYEILLIDDGSRDGTWKEMTRLAASDPFIIAVSLSRNFGHQAAVSAGLALCEGARVLLIDADLQDPPEALIEMNALMERENADVVYGRRTIRRGETWSKRASAAFFYRLLRHLTEIEIPVDTGDFRLISRRAVVALGSMPERSRFLRGMASWIGLKQVPFAYERAPRAAGQSHYSWRKMLGFARDAITSFSIVPLRLASYCGLASGMLALGLLVYALRAWLLGETVPGWTSLMVIVLFLGCVQLLCLGLFGEYLGRLYLESKHRPLFIIQDIVRR